MFKVINRDYVQTYQEIMNEFPGCHFLAIKESGQCGEGKLVAISEEPESYKELCDYRREHQDVNYYQGGFYKEGIGVGLQTIVRS